MSPPSRFDFDLLAWKPLRLAVQWRGIPVLFQVVSLAAIVGLVAAGLGVGAGLSQADLWTLRRTNLATLVVWGLWWPAVITATVTCGRVWCMACPMELVSRIAHALARRVGLPGLRLGRLLHAGWMGLAAYLALQLGVTCLGIHHVPHDTALLLLTLLGSALLVGLVFREPRSFCSAFCPAAALLSVYGRLARFQVEARDGAVCQECTTRDCMKADAGCPSHVRIFERRPSDGCVSCLQCVKACPRANVGLGLVGETAPVRRRALLRPVEAVFVMLAVGFVAHEMVDEAARFDAVFHAVPDAVAAMLFGRRVGWIRALWDLVVFPGEVGIVLGVVASLFGRGISLSSRFLAVATGAAPVVALVHLCVAVAKGTSRVAFLPMALGDPHGLGTLRRMAEHTLVQPGWVGGAAVWGGLVLLLIFWCRARTWLRQAPAEEMGAARIGLIGTAALFVILATARMGLGTP